MLNRKSAPAFVHSSYFDLLKPEIHRLGGGGTVYFIHGGEQDVIKVEFIFRAGKWFEDKPGVSSFTASMLAKGTPKFSSTQIAEKFDFYGVHVESHAGHDFMSMAFYALSRNLPFVLDLVLDLIQNALFHEDELRQEKVKAIQALKINSEKTSFLATKLFKKQFFGDSHPYGTELDYSSIESITSDDLRSFRNTYFNDFTIFVAGKFNDELKKEVINRFDSVLYTSNPSKTAEIIQSKEHYQYSEKPATIQTSIRIGRLTIGRTHHNFPSLLLLNHVLGGYFGSRLMKNIREEKGYTYGIHSSLVSHNHASYWIITSDVNKQSLQRTIEEVNAELSRLCDEKISYGELEAARNHFIGSLQTEMISPFSHADKIKQIVLYNLNYTYFQNLIDSINGAAPETLQQLASDYFSNKDIFITAAG